MNASHVEELISMVTLCAALLAWNGNIKWLAYILFAKALMDTICALAQAFKSL